MKEQKIRFTPIPSTAEVEAERERLAYRSRYMRVLRSTVYTLLVVAAVAGFPSGKHDSSIKAAEAKLAASRGATEIDMVIDVGAAVAGNFAAVRDDIAAVRQTMKLRPGMECATRFRRFVRS